MLTDGRYKRKTARFYSKIDAALLSRFTERVKRKNTKGANQVAPFSMINSYLVLSPQGLYYIVFGNDMVVSCFIFGQYCTVFFINKVA